MIYDEEQMIRDVEFLFKEKLSEQITLINKEKNDALVLETIPDDKYIFETLDGRKLLNYRGFFILYGLVSTGVQASTIENFIEDVTMTFQIATFDKGEKDRTNLMYKLLRYRRALKQVIIKNNNVFRGFAKPLITSLKPDAFSYNNNKVILTIGIDIKAAVTAN